MKTEATADPSPVTFEFSPEDFAAHVARLFMKPETRHARLLHAALGCAGECGEIINAVKKTWIYGKPLDVENVIEECGDILFYLQAACTECSQTLDQLAAIIATARAASITTNNITNWQLFDQLANSGNVTKKTTALTIIMPLTALSNATSALLTLCALDNNDRRYNPTNNRTYELSAILLRTSQILGCVGSTIVEATQQHKVKLARRYPVGYTDAAAIAQADK